jgi:putative ABC transport system substrate-binding protein
MQFDHLKRRGFITLLGGAAAAWPRAARAQQPAMPLIGFLGSGSSEGYVQFVAAFRTGLRETGYVDDRSVAIEFRWAEGQYDRLMMPADLKRLHKYMLDIERIGPSSMKCGQ